MGTLRGPIEGGSGGKRGHSNMEHWAETAEIKDATRRSRRREAKAAVREQLDEPVPGETTPQHPDRRDRAR